MLAAARVVAQLRAVAVDGGADRTMTMNNLTPSSLYIATSLVISMLGFGTASAQEIFATPETAAQSLIDAAKNSEKGFLPRLFGPGYEQVFLSGDAQTDQERLKKFNQAAASSFKLQTRNDSVRLLQIGPNQWVFPVPIVKTDRGWQFDLAAGKIELRNREIGENEFAAIEACKSFAQAQQEYFMREPMGDDIPHYARKIISSPGQKDGLYWPATNPRDRSPLEGFMIDSVLESQAIGKPVPYKGYFYRVLTAQGPSAPGGALSYLVNGRMLIGAALIATPAQWGQSGMMTFICNHRGRIYERNLGADTKMRAQAIQSFDPNSNWQPVQN
jgi:Protein of unknown function (DUF2950)